MQQLAVGQVKIYGIFTNFGHLTNMCSTIKDTNVEKKTNIIGGKTKDNKGKCTILSLTLTMLVGGITQILVIWETIIPFPLPIHPISHAQ